ncbi:mannose-6-phosphate isomerase, class I [Corynebacterium ulceribovis]|uniref:mannose-6-phosphate isomerase, class I n=1 Tax=Corynebacterium ulceribovis TaxID=487732 RepID=UPI0003A4F581|nr:mannose-6-phosphate isomerase, class I [Corynebacterium ulceribovis]
MERLTGAMRYYPWGSRTLLANLTGRQIPVDRPEAELWFGAHPTGSAMVGDRSLLDIISQDPKQHLGERVVTQHGETLPFLLKLLSAEQPLSLQAHPTIEQAQAGFAAENAAGIAVDAPNRNYRDANHKPELIVAVTQFEALAGFRPVAQTRELIDVLGTPGLQHYAVLLDGEDEADSLRALFTTWINLPGDRVDALVNEVVADAERVVASEAPEWIRTVAASVVQIAQRYPGDIGVLGVLLLNRITLQPGEGIFMGPGQLHAYLSGLGVEIMANSDNVLRGGLTSKHVDVPELLRVLNFTPNSDPLIKPQVKQTSQGNDYLHYDTPVDEFYLDQAALTEEPFVLNHDGPVLVLCTQGEVSAAAAQDDTSALKISQGEALWVSAAESDIELRAQDAQQPTRVFFARV